VRAYHPLIKREFRFLFAQSKMCLTAIPQEIPSLIPGLPLSSDLLKVRLVISTVLRFGDVWFCKEKGIF